METEASSLMKMRLCPWRQPAKCSYCLLYTSRVDDLGRFLLVGELGLDGSVRAVPGMLPVAILAREKGIANLVLPAANAAEAAVVEGVNVYPVSSLIDVIDLLNSSVVGVIQREPVRTSTEELLSELQHFTVDFKDVRGQQSAKRALEAVSYTHLDVYKRQVRWGAA